MALRGLEIIAEPFAKEGAVKAGRELDGKRSRIVCCKGASEDDVDDERRERGLDEDT